MARTPPSLDLPFHANSGSWLNAVENFFSVLTRKRYLAEHNADPKPFVWKASTASIIEAQQSASIICLSRNTNKLAQHEMDRRDQQMCALSSALAIAHVRR